MGKTVNSVMLGQASGIECAKIGNSRFTQGPDSVNASGFAEAMKNAQQVRKFTMSEDEFYKIRYNCSCTDGVDVHFPPDNATDAQKLLWCDLVGPRTVRKEHLC